MLFSLDRHKGSTTKANAQDSTIIITADGQRSDRDEQAIRCSRYLDAGKPPTMPARRARDHVEIWALNATIKDYQSIRNLRTDDLTDSRYYVAVTIKSYYMSFTAQMVGTRWRQPVGRAVPWVIKPSGNPRRVADGCRNSDSTPECRSSSQLALMPIDAKLLLMYQHNQSLER